LQVLNFKKKDCLIGTTWNLIGFLVSEFNLQAVR